MVNKQAYEKGLRCRGICEICNKKTNCYQWKKLKEDKTKEGN